METKTRKYIVQKTAIPGPRAQELLKRREQHVPRGPSNTDHSFIEKGEGGFVIPSNRFIKGIWDICDKYGILFIADEIQTGFGRTGKLFAMEHFAG